jgi:hypothetical protein
VVIVRVVVQLTENDTVAASLVVAPRVALDEHSDANVMVGVKSSDRVQPYDP